MHTIKYAFLLIILISISSCAINLPSTPGEKNEILDVIKIPENMKIEIYSEVPGARSMAYDGGILYVGTRGNKLYAVVDSNEDYLPERVTTIASGLDMPNGVALKDGDLYVSQVYSIIRFDNIKEKIIFNETPKYEIIYDDLPSDRAHGWKFIRFGPDGLLYVPVGAPCNVCEIEYPYGTILRMSKEGENVELYAQGIRNTVGFDWNPQTNELWFTDNGADWMGEDKPDDELNVVKKIGEHFGYPKCHSIIGEVNSSCASYSNAQTFLGPHVAALGMRFYSGRMFPEYANKIFIAEHGSWNRKQPIGYRVVTVNPLKPSEYEVFAEGWLKDNKTLGRPVDIEELPDGSILISDDHAGLIYRISEIK
ncbi:MAG: PQQ-dependent sugar dehydrogenase [Candidatus Woesearchaeota archaeon]